MLIMNNNKSNMKTVKVAGVTNTIKTYLLWGVENNLITRERYFLGLHIFSRCGATLSDINKLCLLYLGFKFCLELLTCFMAHHQY